jgi:cell division protein FtsB
LFFYVSYFFGNRSVWKIFELNHQINEAKQELIILSDKKNYTLSEIELLRDDNLDPDIISEIVQNSLGLIHSDQIVIEISK